MHYNESVEKVLNDTGSGFVGLKEEEAKRRFDKSKPNEIRHTEKTTLFKIILNQIKDAMVIILLIASILSFLLHDYLEGIVIIIIVFIDTIIGVLQEYKAETAIESLKQLAPNYSYVIRDNKIRKI